MSREPEPSLNEREFVRSALSQGLRLDGRELDAFRPISLAFPSDLDTYGQADVRIGKTRVLCNVSAEVTAPYTDRKFDGIFTINSELSPMASPAFETGRQDQVELLLSRTLEKTIRRSNALDTESLCIVAGSKCFHVRADLHVLDHDGNLVDASCLALVAALQHFRRPDVEVHGEDVTVFSVREREPVKLTIHHTPFCVTTSYYAGGSIMLKDATLVEEQCREGEVVVSMNRFGEVCSIAKLGGPAVDGLALLQVIEGTVEKVKALDRLLKEKLAEDEKIRDRGGLMDELRAENERPRI